jgi:predicted chitinase
MTASENNWEPLDIRPGDPRLQWFDVPGVDVQLQLNTERDAHKIMLAVAADFNAFIEPLRNGDSAAYTDGNSVFTSNHKNATAMDLNWEGHAFHVVGTFNQDQQAVIAEMEDFYEGYIFWAGRWGDPVDEMHWQIGYDAWGDPDGMADFIRRKIRPDGFSTMRRGAAPVQPAGVVVLQRATGLSAQKCAEILPTLSGGLKLAQCNNPRRIANFIGQTRHESDNYNTTTEYASGAEYEGRDDLGNTEDGDGVKFKGRTWIQITGRFNYGAFSKWAWGNGLITNPSQFVDNPDQLSDIRWAGIGAAWYWIVQRPQLNSLADDNDIEGVTRAINGGTNGLDQRIDFTNQALAVGDDLMVLASGPATPVPPTPPTPPTPGDSMANVPQDQWDRVYRELTQLLPSRSPLRHLGEGPIDTVAGITLNIDGSSHIEYVKTLAAYGHPPTIALLREVASARGDARYPDRQDDAMLAIAILAGLNDTTVVAPSAPKVVYLPPPPPPPVPASEEVFAPPVAQTVAAPEPATADSSAGQVIGQAFDALHALLGEADALTDSEKVTYNALISALNTKIGVPAK